MNSIHQTIRSLLKSPGFAVTALATLAICIGANLTIFAVVDSVLLKPLPYPESDKLVSIYYTYPKLDSANDGASLTTYYERRGEIPAFSSLSAIGLATSVVGETGATTIENLGRVTPEFFSTLGIEPFIGRSFTDEEMTYQTDHVAILSHEYWRSHFQSDTGVLGKTIRLDGIPRVIVGVLPPEFRFLSFQAPVYMPLSSEESERNVEARHSLGTIQIARLASGATLGDAQAQIDAHDAAHAAEFSQAQLVAESGCHSVVASLHGDHVASIRPTLVLLQAGAVCLLLIGGVNLVNLLLIRASGRSRELAIRRALGANQIDVVREVLTESTILTAIGGILGLAVGAIGIKLVATLGVSQMPLGSRIAFDGRIVVVAFIFAVVTGIAIGLPVAWFNLRNRLAIALQGESRGSTASRATQRLRHGFIIAQIAVAFVLLAGASLLGISLKRAMDVAPGFRSDHVLTGQFSLTWSGYHDLESFHRFFDRLDEASNSLPGVSAVGVISNVPISGSQNSSMMTIPGRPPEAATVHNYYGVAGDYFAAMGIPLRAGRFLERADADRETFTCVVDETFARLYWPEGGAVGQQVYRSAAIEDDDPPYTIVGVVGAVKQTGLTETQSSGAVYFPYSRVFIRNYFLVARTNLPPEALGATMAKVVREVDAEMPLTDLRSMEVRLTESLATRRSPALMAGVFAGTALLLAAIGLYGVLAFAVSQRTNEFGIRMALGAQRWNVLGLVFWEGMRLITIGLVLGIVGALFLTEGMRSLLFNISPNDPLTLVSVAGLLAAIAALACLLPARRATKVDPMVALRND